MDYVVAVALVAGPYLAFRLLWVAPSWLDAASEAAARRAAADERPDDPVHAPWGLLSPPFVRRRLDALDEELERLDRDPDVFAKAFHLAVVRSAHAALLADASRLPAQPLLRAGQVFDVDVLGPSTGRREELEL